MSGRKQLDVSKVSIINISGNFMLALKRFVLLSLINFGDSNQSVIISQQRTAS
jgi:hypothetical protein